MSAPHTKKPRIYTLPENLKRAVKRAGLSHIPYDVLEDTSLRIPTREALFKPRTPAERELVLKQRFQIAQGY